jgi:hypothetical protein
MSSKDNNMRGCGTDGKSNEEVIEEMKRQSKRTGRPEITEISDNVTSYDFSPRDASNSESSEVSGDGRISVIEGKVDQYVDQGMDLTDAAKAAYKDVNTAYEEDAASMNEVRMAVQELESYVEKRGGDLQEAAKVLDTEINEAQDRAENASERIDDVYDDLLS